MVFRQKSRCSKLQEPFGNRKHLLRYRSGEIGGFFTVRTYGECLFHMPRQVAHFVRPRIKELRRRCGKRNDHERPLAFVIGIRQSGVEFIPNKAVPRVGKVHAVASDSAKLLQYLACPISAYGVINPHFPQLVGQYEVLHDHIISSQFMQFPLPMQSA